MSTNTRGPAKPHHGSQKAHEVVSTMYAYVVIASQEGEIWDQVGDAAVWSDGQITIQLWAFPVSGRIVLVDDAHVQKKPPSGG